MRTYAEVDENYIVINTAIFEDDVTPVDLDWPNWYETAENIRKNQAGIGSTFVPEAEGYPLGLFYPPSPHNGWVLDADYVWGPPADKPYPDGYGEPPNTWWWDDLIEDWDQKSPAPEPE